MHEYQKDIGKIFEMRVSTLGTEYNTPKPTAVAINKGDIFLLLDVEPLKSSQTYYFKYIILYNKKICCVLANNVTYPIYFKCLSE